MAAYLVTWNPARWPWRDLETYVRTVREQGFIDDTWNVGSRQIVPGDRIFLMRLGLAPRGIMGAGTATSAVRLGPHWDETKRGRRLAGYVELRWEALRDPDQDPILPRAMLKDRFPGMLWDTQMSGIRIPDGIAADVEDAWQDLVSDTPDHSGGRPE